MTKEGAYSWIKAPRYDGAVYEVGPLARMTIAGLYSGGTSVMDRLRARARESYELSLAMFSWLDELAVGEPTHVWLEGPSTGTGMGLTEAPRGALGHWIDIVDSKINGYQIVTPTAWNASPLDGFGQRGAIEEALVGTPVADTENPIEPLRVVHSYDPCLACAVHVVRARGAVRGHSLG
jgi:hydrogenase large subunit